MIEENNQKMEQEHKELVDESAQEAARAKRQKKSKHQVDGSDSGPPEQDDDFDYLAWESEDQEGNADDEQEGDADESGGDEGEGEENKGDDDDDNEEGVESLPSTLDLALPANCQILPKPTKLTQKPLQNKLFLLRTYCGWARGRIKLVHGSAGENRRNLTVRFHNESVDYHQQLDLDLYQDGPEQPAGTWCLFGPRSRAPPRPEQHPSATRNQPRQKIPRTASSPPPPRSAVQLRRSSRHGISLPVIHFCL